ncbi:lysosome membrane protein 2-like [Palaemon carinicauda]|uniref:lysosome membrane protein 2-like n=1 Tax=Palaemon carinicauda TaxID=392227 RepID=UPI0035B63B04
MDLERTLIPEMTKKEEMSEDGDDERGETSDERMTEEELEALVKTKQVRCCLCSPDNDSPNRAEIKPFREKGRRGRKQPCCLFRKNRCCCCRWQCLLTMALVSFISLMAVLAWMDSFIHDSLMDGLVMKDGSPKDHMWRAATVPAYYSVRIFNLTNPSQFMAGDPPRVVEMGPYVYAYRELKENVHYNDDGTVRYQGRPLYTFQHHLSEGREEDVVTTVNIPFVNAAEMVKNTGVVKTIMKVMKKVKNFDTIRTVTVKELLWGHRSRVLDWARSMHQDIPYPHKEFGLLMGLNNSLQPPYEMHTGLDDPSRMNQIVTWKKKQLMDFWFGTECNVIRGTDANGFPPGLSKEDKLFIFNGQLCRTLSLVYNSTVTRQGLEAYRFVPPEDIFKYGPDLPENQCYCSNVEGCPSDGLVDMKPCYFGAAVAFSFPHFYNGYPKLWHAVKGLR